jgi:hypothetical protein
LTSAADMARCWQRSWTATRVHRECSSTCPTWWRRPTAPSTGIAAGRVEKVAGDFSKAVPPGEDAYLLKWIVHDWDDEAAMRILTNCRTAMAPAGKVLLVEVVIPDDTAGSDATRLDTTMLVFTGSRERTAGEYRDLLHRAGLILIKTTPTPTPFSILEATSAQDGQR